MLRSITLSLTVALVLTGCDAGAPAHPAAPADPPAAEDPASVAPVDAASPAVMAGLERQAVPSENPGPPFYARVTTIANQLYNDGEWLVVPFYRPPDCVPADFNMLALYDPPGPGGPGAFACELLIEGFVLMEPGSPPGTFPRHAVLEGDAVPFWFVPWDEFQAVAADGVVTIGDLADLDPLVGVADRYHETLRPRLGDHLVSIQAGGTLQDGRAFVVDIVNVEHGAWNVHIQIQ